MSYYHGDFYQGDFYRGDPGFFSFLGKAVRGVASLGAGMIPGVGGIVSKAITKIGPRGTAIVMRAGTAIAKHPVLSGAAAAGTVGMLGAGVGRMGSRMGASGVGPMVQQRGMHVSKRTGAMVRNRRMRVTNVRALRRAIRRCTGFAHLAKRVLRFTSPRPPRGRAVFKARRRAKKI